jgi:hypothetical protein
MDLQTLGQFGPWVFGIGAVVIVAKRLIEKGYRPRRLRISQCGTRMLRCLL